MVARRSGGAIEGEGGIEAMLRGVARAAEGEVTLHLSYPYT